VAEKSGIEYVMDDLEWMPTAGTALADSPDFAGVTHIATTCGWSFKKFEDGSREATNGFTWFYMPAAAPQDGGTKDA
jgi:hypothetical protein